MVISRRAPRSENLRRLPTQERAQRTIQAIFEATAQIVENEGEAGLTTNKVARRAGFSIGTLYQYFPSKEAILVALIQRERRRVMDRLQSMMREAVDQMRPVREALQDMVHLLVESFGGGPRARRAMIRLAWRLDHHEDITQALREASERNSVALAAMQDPQLRAPDPTMMFVATRAVMGAIRSASLEDSPMLGTPAFEAELVRLIWGMLRRD